MRDRGGIAKPLLAGEGLPLRARVPLSGMRVRCLLLAGWTVVGSTLAAQGHLVAPPVVFSDPKAAALYERLQKTIVPHVDFNATDIVDAIQFLNVEGKAHDPAHKGFHIVLDLTPLPGKPAQTIRRSITMQTTNLSLLDVLGYTAHNANLIYKITADGVVLRPLPE